MLNCCCYAGMLARMTTKLRLVKLIGSNRPDFVTNCAAICKQNRFGLANFRGFGIHRRCKPWLEGKSLLAFLHPGVGITNSKFRDGSLEDDLADLKSWRCNGREATSGR
jgi:hypothetical protein